MRDNYKDAHVPRPYIKAKVHSVDIQWNRPQMMRWCESWYNGCSGPKKVANYTDGKLLKSTDEHSGLRLLYANEIADKIRKLTYLKNQPIQSTYQRIWSMDTAIAGPMIKRCRFVMIPIGPKMRHELHSHVNSYTAALRSVGDPGLVWGWILKKNIIKQYVKTPWANHVLDLISCWRLSSNTTSFTHIVAGITTL